MMRLLEQTSTLGSVSGATPSKRRSLSEVSLTRLRRLAEDGDDEALNELVSRDREYLFTDLARAKVALWSLQRQLASHGQTRTDRGASTKLRQLGIAIGRSVSEKLHSIGSFERALSVATKRVHDAASYVSKRRTPDTEHMSQKFKISKAVAAYLVEKKSSRRAKDHMIAIDMEAGSILGLKRDRVGQLRRELKALRAHGWLD